MTCGIRPLIGWPATRQMPLTDVQWVLGHAHLSTTQLYLTPTIEDMIAEVLAHHAAARRGRLRHSGAVQRRVIALRSLQVLFGRPGR